MTDVAPSVPSTPVGNVPAQSSFNQGNTNATDTPVSEVIPDIPKYGFDDEIEATVQGQKQKVRLKDLVAGYQKYQTGEFRLQEASKTRKDLEEREHRLRSGLEGAKKNPAALLREALGSDDAVKLFAEDYIWQQIQDEKVPQEVREARKRESEMQQKLSDYERKEQAQLQQQEVARVQHYRNHYDSLFADALQTGGLPKTPETIERMSKFMQSSIANGYEPSKQELIEAVEGSYTKEIGSVFSKMPIEKVLKLLGDDLSKKIREYDLAKIQNPMQQQQRQQFNTQSNLNQPDHDDRLSMADAKKQWRANAGLPKY